MNCSELKVQDLVRDIGVCNKTLNNYLNTFNIKYKSNKYLLNTAVYDLRDYHIITKNFYELILSHKNSLLEYEEDYYKWKSIRYISNKIGFDLKRVLNYFSKLDLENHRSPFFNRYISSSNLKFKGTKYDLGSLLSGFLEIENEELIDTINKDLCDSYKNRTLFKENSEFNFLSSYEVERGIRFLDDLELNFIDI